MSTPTAIPPIVAVACMAAPIDPSVSASTHDAPPCSSPYGWVLPSTGMEPITRSGLACEIEIPIRSASVPASLIMPVSAVGIPSIAWTLPLVDTGFSNDRSGTLVCWPEPRRGGHPMRARRAAFAVVSAALMLATGCSSMGSAFKTPGAISGMVGTTPLTPLSEDFKQRLRAVDPALSEYEYSGESYDAVVISALAVQIARTTDPPVVAKYINAVTTLTPGGVECDTIKKCFDAVAAGKDIAYRGVTVRSGFTDDGEPSTTSYGTLHFGRDNKIDEGKTEFVSAGDSKDATRQPEPPPAAGKGKGDALRLGLLVPKTGGLAGEGVPIAAGAHLAIKEINALGGVLGKAVTYEDAEDGTDPTKSVAALDKLIADGIGIVIGPSTSGESVALIPKAVAAGRILFSYSATSAALTKADDHGLYFRTSPSDVYQSQAISDVIMRGGARRVFIIAAANPYGNGVRDGVTEDLAKAGIKKLDIGSLGYKDGQKDYSEIVQAVRAFNPD